MGSVNKCALRLFVLGIHHSCYSTFFFHFRTFIDASFIFLPFWLLLFFIIKIMSRFRWWKDLSNVVFQFVCRLLIKLIRTRLLFNRSLRLILSWIYPKWFWVIEVFKVLLETTSLLLFSFFFISSFWFHIQFRTKFCT